MTSGGPIFFVFLAWSGACGLSMQKAPPIDLSSIMEGGRIKNGSTYFPWKDFRVSDKGANLDSGFASMNDSDQASVRGCSISTGSYFLNAYEYVVFSSPKYPNSVYPKNQDCQWNFETSSSNMLKIFCQDDFRLQAPGNGYCYDYLRLSPYSGVYCGTGYPNDIELGTSAYVLFHSNKRYNYRGFKCAIQAIPTSSSGCKCGKVDRATRIIGGQATEVNEYPWQAALFVSNSFYCGGSIINERYVLTAAHCTTYTYNTGAKIPESQITVVLGAHDLRYLSNAVLYNVEANIVHENYIGISNPSLSSQYSDSDMIVFDIALLRLTTTIDFTNPATRPVCLPESMDNEYANKVVTSTGWGHYDNGLQDISYVLQEVVLQTLSYEDCRYNSNYALYAFKIPYTNLCSGVPQGGQSVCNGDSGGPTVFDAGDNTHELVAVTSFSYKPSGCGSPGFPDANTRVTAFLPWIRTIVGSTPTCPR